MMTRQKTDDEMTGTRIKCVLRTPREFERFNPRVILVFWSELLQRAVIIFSFPTQHSLSFTNLIYGRLSGCPVVNSC